jgi:hypothetical protein
MWHFGNSPKLRTTWNWFHVHVPLLDQGLSAVLSAEWSVEVLSMLITSDGPLLIAKFDLFILFFFFFLCFSTLQKRVLHDCWVVH